MRKTAIVLVLLGLILAAAFPLVMYVCQSEEAFSPYNLVRIHIVAHSDNPADQQVKMHIKDRLVAMLSSQLAGAKNVEESRGIIAANLDKIQTAARQELEQRGFGYGAQAVLGEFEFPTRSYGELILPQGEYLALKVVLGKGEGKNWWCVLFPPLCFQEGQDNTLIYQGEKPAFFLKEKLFTYNRSAWWNNSASNK